MKHPDKLVEVGVNRAASVRPILFPRASVTVDPDVRRPLPRGELEPLGELGRRATCGLIVGGLLRPPKRPQTQCNADRIQVDSVLLEVGPIHTPDLVRNVVRSARIIRTLSGDEYLRKTSLNQAVPEPATDGVNVAIGPERRARQAQDLR